MLKIGAPLIAGLDTGQLAGILAHEFGHFTQGTGLRLTYMVRAINYWFVRVVYERDGWDQWLEETANDWDFRVGWILRLSQLCVLVSRGILWVFMVVGHAASGFMLRQMEFHADAHESRLVGGPGFAATTRRLARLNVAYAAAMRDLGQMVDHGRLPDDLPQLMLMEDIAQPDELVAEIERQQQGTKTGWFDTHPADRDRIRRAAREGTIRHSPTGGRPRCCSAISPRSPVTRPGICTGPISAAVFSRRGCSRRPKPCGPATRACGRNGRRSRSIDFCKAKKPPSPVRPGGFVV